MKLLKTISILILEPFLILLRIYNCFTELMSEMFDEQVDRYIKNK